MKSTIVTAARRRILQLAFAAFAALAAPLGLVAVLPGSAWAQGYPDRPIKLLVPFSPGGGTDVYARLLAKGMGDALGQPVVVENDAGGAGMLALQRVAKAPNDGYTLLVGTSTNLSAAPHLYTKLPYKAEDFTPVALLVKFPFHVYVNPDVPAKSWAEFSAQTKAHPGKVNFGTTGRGSTPHLVGELVKQAAGLSMVDVPYKGGAPALADVMSGQIQLYFDTPVPGMSYVKAGKLRLLAVLDDKRSPLAPDVPTLTELGVPVVAYSRFSLLAPAGTPAAVVDKLNQAALAAMAAGPLRDRQIADGAAPGPVTPAQLAAMLKTDHDLWGAVIRKVGIRLD